MSGIPYFWISLTLPLCIANQAKQAEYFKGLSILFLPYVFKPLFAAVLHILEKLLIRHHFIKYSVLSAQAVIVFCLYQSAQYTNPFQFEKLWMFGIIIACFGAIQDIVSEGYRIEISKTCSFSVRNLFGNQTGFRIAGFFVSSGALGIAHYGSWKISSYVIMIGLMISMIVIMMDPLFSVSFSTKDLKLQSYWCALKDEFKDMFFQNRIPFWVFIHLFSYKVIDAFIRWILPLFLYSQGYSNIELMYADKGMGWIGFLLGGFFAHKSLQYASLKQSLLGWGIVQTVGYSTYLLQWNTGKHMGLIFFNAFIHQILSGSGNILIWIYISNYCRSSHTMMRYSIISAYFTLDRLCVVWCASWLYGNTNPGLFFVLGILFSACSVLTFLYPKK
ncbi:putative transporter AmpG 3 [Holospora obtusa F1]|uniref:Transporter AmpG 3 n=2 Tax=Holospora obtusa TaxID=49893 RepID=W6TEV6_HOLOB|nr:putative transporter AmpG 3 [Holospora obtusa F1]